MPHNLSEEDKERLRQVLEPLNPVIAGVLNEKVRHANMPRFERMGLIKVDGDKAELTSVGRQALSKVQGR